MESPLVSIVCGYYNRADVVDESIQSLLDQTYKNIEIIIFDDCSSDGTYEKLMRFQLLDTRVKILRHAENKGFVRGIRDAIASSKGEYIAIHGSGDFSYPTRIEKQVAVLEKREDIGLVGCFVKNINVSNSPVTSSFLCFDVDGNYSSLLTQKNLFTHGEVMYRRALYDKVGGYREFFKFTQDYDLWSRMSLHSNFFTINEVLYQRYLLDDGVSIIPKKRLYQDLLATLVRNNLAFRLKGNDLDYVDLYPDNPFSYITVLNDRDVNNLLLSAIKVHLTTDARNEMATDVFKLLQTRSNKKIFSSILKIMLNFLPQSISKRLFSKRILVQGLLFSYRHLA